MLWRWVKDEGAEHWWDLVPADPDSPLHNSEPLACVADYGGWFAHSAESIREGGVGKVLAEGYAAGSTLDASPELLRDTMRTAEAEGRKLCGWPDDWRVEPTGAPPGE